jgi:hypothetical protein
MGDWLLSTAWYGSLLTAAIAAIGLIRPIALVGFPTRSRALIAAAAATAAIVAIVWNAPRDRGAAGTETVLDRVMPVYQFREMHERSIDAPPERVITAIKTVTASEIALFQLFTAIRRFGRTGPASILNAPADTPILDVATHSGFVLLADTERELVLATVVVAPRGMRPHIDRTDSRWFEGLTEPGIAKAAMNFHLEAAGPGRTRVTTETRVFATDRATVRRFAAYWRTIFPGSWILRVTWLRAIAARAEARD